MANVSTAGARLLSRFIELERLGKLQKFVNGLGEDVGSGLTLPTGDGSALAAAKKLDRDGMAKLRGGTRNRNRFLVITDEGRAVLATLSPALQESQS